MSSDTKKPVGRPKSPQPRKIPRMVSLSVEMTEYLNQKAIRDGRSPASVVEQLLLEDSRRFCTYTSDATWNAAKAWEANQNKDKKNTAE